jgi:hypothetical protein
LLYAIRGAVDSQGVGKPFKQLVYGLPEVDEEYYREAFVEKVPPKLFCNWGFEKLDSLSASENSGERRIWRLVVGGSRIQDSNSFANFRIEAVDLFRMLDVI